MEVCIHEQYMCMQALMPCEKFQAEKKFDIRQTSNLRYHFLLMLTNDAPITGKLLRLKPQEEV